MINSEAIMETGGTCIKLMIFVPADDRVNDELIREKFDSYRRDYRQFIVNYTAN
jgi:hypothetical protein